MAAVVVRGKVRDIDSSFGASLGGGVGECVGLGAISGLGQIYAWGAESTRRKRRRWWWWWWWRGRGVSPVSITFTASVVINCFVSSQDLSAINQLLLLSGCPETPALCIIKKVCVMSFTWRLFWQRTPRGGAASAIPTGNLNYKDFRRLLAPPTDRPG